MFLNRTSETCTGIGNVLTLTGAVATMNAFGKAGNGEDGAAYSCVVDDADGVVHAAGTYTFDKTANTLTRNDTWNDNGTTIDKNPAANIALSAGVHTVSCEFVDRAAQGAEDAEYGYGFSAVSTTNAVETIAGNSWVEITGATLDLVEYNKDGVFSNGVFTPSKKGIYLITGLVTVRGLDNDAKMVIALYKNGLINKLLSRGTAGGTQPEYAGYGGAVQVVVDNVTDAYQIRVYQTGSDTLTAHSNGYSAFSALRVSGL